jgi:AcrR family transcriptional regulator
MKAKSDALAGSRRKVVKAPHSKATTARKSTTRMPAKDRKAQILDKAFGFFSENGLTAQTRALADACGVSQRLLYSVFPNKASLISAVYEAEIAGPFKAIWFVRLQERNVPLEERLVNFYREYYEAILTRKWLRLFIYASLAEVEIAPTYIAEIIRNLLETITLEAAHAAGVEAPKSNALLQEIGWVLHGNISHLGIRRHVYLDTTSIPVDTVIRMHVAAFLMGIPHLLKNFKYGGHHSPTLASNFSRTK